MPVNDELGSRMKNFYEAIPKIKLMRRTPVAIRLDGRAFHTFTKGFQKPFDPVLVETMQETMKYLCENIQGCVLGYTQSDEITLILVDYKKLTSAAWFDYDVQKVCSVSAGMATAAFNQYFKDIVNEDWEYYTACKHDLPMPIWTKLTECYHDKIGTATFDSRCFNIPREEVANLIYWRQLDAIRNSIQSVGQTYFSKAELKGKSCKEIKKMLLEKYWLNWDEIDTPLQRGSCYVKQKNGWSVDKNIPMFKGEDRKYIENLIKEIE